MADFQQFESVVPGAGEGVVVSGPMPGSAIGQSVVFLGDANGDGIGDFAVSSLDKVWVVFGRADGTAPDLLSFPASGLGPDGFVYEVGASSGGFTLSALGDIDGDGLGDLGIGAPGLNGGDGFWLTMTDLGTSPAVVSHQGDTLSGAGAAMAAGDFNGDGLTDLLVGAPTLYGAGGVYLQFGGGPRVLFLGDQAGSLTGAAVSNAGDVNGDGIDDILIGAPKAAGAATEGGSAYVVFGHTGGWAFSDSLYDLNGTDGFRIDGNYDHSGLGASTASGDINGDGFSDLVIGSPGLEDATYGRNGVYVIFGHGGPFTASYNVQDRDGSDAFRFWGNSPFDGAGQHIAVGDVNGDGLDDLATFGAASDYDLGYVLFGKTTPFAFGPTPPGLNGTNGFFIDGEYFASIDLGDRNPSVAIGDVNGDGAADLIYGIADLNGTEGAVVIRYGQATDVTRTGTAGADYLISGAGADVLLGLAGKDKLIGGFGNDLMDGGADNDVLHAGAGADIVGGGLGADSLYGDDGDDTLSGGDGGDKLFGGTGGDTLTGGAGADRLDGGTGGDTLNGGADNDYLDGGAGADSMTGGAGNDVFLFDDAGDAAVEQANGGYDIVRNLVTATLAANVEALQLQGSADIDGTGNAEANNLQGNSGANVLKGLAGVDTISGGDGDDTLVGGLANDLLRGGMGADTFVVLQESLGTAVLETDQIFDFSAAEGDRLDLSAIDANPFLNGDQAFRLVGALGKHDAAHPELTGQMTLTFAGGVTLVRLDVNGDGRADYQLKINGDVTGESGDWLL